MLSLQTHLPAAPLWSWVAWERPPRLPPQGEVLDPPGEALGSDFPEHLRGLPPRSAQAPGSASHLSSGSGLWVLRPARAPSSLSPSHKGLPSAHIRSLLCTPSSAPLLLSSCFCPSLSLSDVCVSPGSTLPLLPSCWPVPTADVNSPAASVYQFLCLSPSRIVFFLLPEGKSQL